MAPKNDKYGFTKYEDIMAFTNEVFQPVNQCLQNNLYQDCVLQINPKTYEYSICKASEITTGYDAYPLIDISYEDIIGKKRADHAKLHDILSSYFYVC